MIYLKFGSGGYRIGLSKSLRYHAWPKLFWLNLTVNIG